MSYAPIDLFCQDSDDGAVVAGERPSGLCDHSVQLGRSPRSPSAGTTIQLKCFLKDRAGTHAASRSCMQLIHSRAAGGAIAGLVGLGAMALVRRSTDKLVTHRPRTAMDVFASERVISPLGVHHREHESAADAIVRFAYTKVVGHEPSPRHHRALARAFRVAAAATTGVVLASAARSRRAPLSSGLRFGIASWLVLDELAFPLLGLSDKPMAYDITQHAQSLALRVGYGVGTAVTTRIVEELR